MKYCLFLIVVLLSNIVQGITGFAGTILAMPPSLMLVGYDLAKPILNVLGLLSGVYVFFTHGKSVNWKEVKKIALIMIIGIISGIYLKTFFIGKEQILYKLLGIFVICLSIQGFYKLYKKNCEEKEQSTKGAFALLISAGVVHGMFVCGGPLLIGYLSKKLKDKVSFRATISTVWIILNSIIMFDDVRLGLWNTGCIKLLIISIPFLILGMFVGAKLYSRMSQELFMKITYILLMISGISLFIK